MKLSVVTVCYNAEKTIDKTIKTVFEQDTPDYEYLIIDGKSTDKTISILNYWKGIFNDVGKNMKIVSEEDGGIYDAMNKAVKIANGEYILFLNSGDELFDSGTISYLNSLIMQDDTYDVIYGDTQLCRVGLYKANLAKGIEAISTDIPFCHQSTITKRERLVDNGYDVHFEICADYDWFLKLYLNDGCFRQVNRPISTYEQMGYSAKNNGIDYFKERLKVRYKNRVISDKEYKKMYDEMEKNIKTIKHLMKKLLPRCLQNLFIQRKLYNAGWKNKKITLDEFYD